MSTACVRREEELEPPVIAHEDELPLDENELPGAHGVCEYGRGRRDVIGN